MKFHTERALGKDVLSVYFKLSITHKTSIYLPSILLLRWSSRGDGNLVKREKPTSLSDVSVSFSGSLNQRNKRVSA